MRAASNKSARRACILETLESRQLMAAGALDPSFSGDGKFTLRFGLDNVIPPYTLIAQDVAVQSDGKTVIAALFNQVNGSGDFPSDFALVRLNFDGTLDKTFGPKSHPGIVLQHLGKAGEDNGVTAVAIQRDGRIVVAGGAIRERSFNSDPFEMAVARFLLSGELDKSFDKDGMRFIEFGGSAASDIALQPDGKIVLAGTRHEGVTSGFDQDFAVARLNRDGSLDKTFDKDGMRTIGFGSDDSVDSVAIDGAGKIILGGFSGPLSDEDEQITLTRLNTNGSTDSTFGSKGKVRTRLPGIQATQARDVLIQPDGKIVVYAQTDPDFREGFDGIQAALLRYLPNGELDGSFGGAGTGFREERFGGIHRPEEIIRSSSGGLITGSFSTDAGSSENSKFTLTAYTADGLVDTRFGKNGRVTTEFGADGTAGSGSIARGPGNRIVMVGGNVLKTARYLDADANTVFVQPFFPDAKEDGPQFGTFLVHRTESLPIPTRVFLNLSGSATNNVDYTTNLKKVFNLPPIIQLGIGKVTVPVSGGDAFIDIPAGAKNVRVVLVPKEDANVEGLETATFTIAPNAAYELRTESRATINIADSAAMRINFQSPATAPSGYLADVGLSFRDQGNGLSYGWDADNSANARIRNNTGSPDFRFDSQALMQKDGANRKWEIAVPNGMYEVHLVAGDPSFTDSVYKMNLESRFVISGTPGGNVRWFERTMNIQVSDGRLTLSNTTGAVNNKVAFIDVKPAAAGAVEGPVTGNQAINLVPRPVTPVTPKVPPIGTTIFSQVLI